MNYFLDPYLVGNEKKYLQDAINSGNKYDYIIAPDEYLVNFPTEEAQIKEIYKLRSLVSKGLYTTLKDYRNMNASQRFFQDPFEVKQDDGNSIIIRKRVNKCTK